MPATLTIEQLVAANKTAADEARTLAAATFAGFEKLVALNMATAKSALFQSSEDFFSPMSASSTADALAASASLVKPLAEQAINYGRAVYEIATETTAQIAQVFEGKLAQGQDAVNATVENIAKNAPAGSESMVAVMKTAFTAGQNAIEAAKTSAKKAVEVAEKQAATLTDTALNSVKTASPARKK